MEGLECIVVESVGCGWIAEGLAAHLVHLPRRLPDKFGRSTRCTRSVPCSGIPLADMGSDHVSLGTVDGELGLTN